MLRAPVDFETLQRSGRSRAHPLVAVRFHHTGRAATRFGLSTGRKLGGAVVRNRVRRRVRAILRSLAARTEPGWDVLVVCRPAAAEAPHRELAAALEGLLARAGIVRAERIER
jgi:ribonuclease P protein component